METAGHAEERHFITTNYDIQARFNSEHLEQCLGTKKAICLWISSLKAPKATYVSIPKTLFKKCVKKT
jgi:hypothetical protein